MTDEKFSFWRSVVMVFALVSVLWIVQFLQVFQILDLSSFANHPRHLDGLKGIIFSPFIHDPRSYEHILSNTLPILVLLTVLINAYPRIALLVLVFVHISTGILVWLFAPENTYHIGISGIVYGIAAFLIASGIFRKNRLSVTISILVTLIYGSIIWGLIPVEGVSWQSHLFGAISGIFMAFVLRQIDLPPPTEFDLEKVEEDKHFFDNLNPPPHN